jgi:hypothetical protein
MNKQKESKKGRTSIQQTISKQASALFYQLLVCPLAHHLLRKLMANST